MRRVLAVGVSGLLAAGLAGCSLWGTEGGPGAAGAAAPTATDTVATATAGPDGVQRVEVSMGDDLRFTPTVVRARPGVLELTFRNAGTTPHSPRLADSLGAAPIGNLNGADARTVRVTIDQPGTYPFPCAYHVSSGMQGRIEVA